MVKAITSRFDISGRRVLDVGVLAQRPRIAFGKSITQDFDSRGRRILDVKPSAPLILPGYIASASSARQAIPEFPIISRGLPVSDSAGFGGPYAAANAVDADYNTTWASISHPTIGAPQWLVIDLRTISSVSKSNIWCILKNSTRPLYQTEALGSQSPSAFSALARNYKLQGHASSGSQPGVNDAGWVDILTITDNRYSERIHTSLDLSNYNWFRFYCTDSSGTTGVTDDVHVEIDLRDARNGHDDSIFVYGDSITMEGFNTRRADSVAWVVGPIENIIEALALRQTPVVIDAGFGGWHASDGDTNKVLHIGNTPCKYVTLSFGSNDANAANIDLNTLTPAGIDSDYAQTYKSHMQSMIDYAYSLNKICIIPQIPYGDLSSWSVPNVIILNQIINQLIMANPGKVLAGPDLFTFFQAHQNLLRDHLHPTWDNSVGAGLYNGLTGYENLLTLWANSLKVLLY